MTEQQRHRRIDGRKPEGAEPPITFALADQEFTCLHAIPAGAVGPLSRDEWRMVDIMHFLEGVLVDKDHPDDDGATQIERLRRTVHGKEVIFNIDDLADLAMWLMGAIARRPTNEPSGSAAGQAATNASSPDGSEQEVSASQT